MEATNEPTSLLEPYGRIVGHVLLHPIVMLLILLAWPTVGLKRKGLYVLAAVPFLVMVELLDVPLMLLGSLQDLVLASTSPDPNRFAPLVTWMCICSAAAAASRCRGGAALLVVAVVQRIRAACSPFPRVVVYLALL